MDLAKIMEQAKKAQNKMTPEEKMKLSQGDFSGIMQQTMKIMGDLNGETSAPKVNPIDCEASVPLTLVEMVTGKTVKLKYKTRRIDKNHKSVKCNNNVDLVVPPGVSPGYTFSVANMGDHIMKGKEVVKGDLMITIAIKPSEWDDQWRLEGRDFYSTLRITLPECYKMCKRIPSPLGDLFVSYHDLSAPLVFTNDIILIADRGLPPCGDERQGHIYIRVNIDLEKPCKFDEESIDKMKTQLGITNDMMTENEEECQIQVVDDGYIIED